MKYCEFCSHTNPDDANFCMDCGRPLRESQGNTQPKLKPGGVSIFALSLAGSILLSLILIFVFGLPIFFIAGFLPLFWLNRNK